MALWMVRVGSYGDHENFALEHNIVLVDGREAGDLATASTRDDLKSILRGAYPDEGEPTIIH